MSEQSQINSTFIKLEEKIDKFKEEFAKEFLSRVKSRTPVITGRLQRSWEIVEYKKSIEIQNSAPYSYYVEYGTPKMAPRGMMRTTIAEKDQITQVARQKAGLK
jgi:hypothetical protein